jgi:hypothetical protein
MKRILTALLIIMPGIMLGQASYMWIKVDSIWNKSASYIKIKSPIKIPELRMGDSSVTVIMEDTLTNTMWVRTYVNGVLTGVDSVLHAVWSDISQTSTEDSVIVGDVKYNVNVDTIPVVDIDAIDWYQHVDSVRKSDTTEWAMDGAWSDIEYGEVDTFSAPVAPRIAYFQSATKIGGIEDFYKDTYGFYVRAAEATGGPYYRGLYTAKGNGSGGSYIPYIIFKTNDDSLTMNYNNLEFKNGGYTSRLTGFNLNIYDGSDQLKVDFNTSTGINTIGDSTIIDDNLFVTQRIWADSVHTLRPPAGWADYVLKPTYKKIDFKEVEGFWQVNSHLPWLEKDGGPGEYINLGKISKGLTEAVEHNYLYDAELRLEVDRLKEENEVLKKHIVKINKLMGK